MSTTAPMQHTTPRLGATQGEPAGRATSVRASQPRLRITRRGRVVLGAILVAPVVVALAVSAFLGTPAVATDSAPAAGLEHVTIMPGESLWDLATSIAPDADPNAVIDDIVALNRLDSADVASGQRLALPASYDR
jgi:hypothetical protein